MLVLSLSGKDGLRVLGGSDKIALRGSFACGDPRAQRASILIIMISLVHGLIRELGVIEAVKSSGRAQSSSAMMSAHF